MRNVCCTAVLIKVTRECTSFFEHLQFCMRSPFKFEVPFISEFNGNLKLINKLSEEPLIFYSTTDLCLKPIRHGSKVMEHGTRRTTSLGLF